MALASRYGLLMAVSRSWGRFFHSLYAQIWQTVDDEYRSIAEELSAGPVKVAAGSWTTFLQDIARIANPGCLRLQHYNSQILDVARELGSRDWMSRCHPRMGKSRRRRYVANSSSNDPPAALAGMAAQSASTFVESREPQPSDRAPPDRTDPGRHETTP
jgi:hypothetical protein